MIVAIGTFVNCLYARFIKELSNVPIIKMKMQGLCFFLIMVQFVMFWTFDFYIIKCEIISNINDIFY
jgi:hypothetical protein